MENFKQKAYNVFELFDRQWAIVTAGSIEHYNSCTVGWGSLGNLWGPTGRSRPAVTVYVHPARSKNSQVYPDFHGGLQRHMAFLGEIIDVIDKR